MAKPTTPTPDNLASFDKLIATIPDVERKGAAMPYTSKNGHMFSFLCNTGKLGLRLPAEDREAFIKKFNAKLCEQHGVVLKEYVEVPDELFKKTGELKKYFALSHAYVTSLKPKPTTRKTSAKKKGESKNRKRS